MRFTKKNCCFGYIIPQTNIVGDNQISTVMLGEGDISDEASVSVMCQNYIVGEPIRQFGLIEDVLEKYGIENAEELDLLLDKNDNLLLSNGVRLLKERNDRLEQELAELKQKAIVPKFKIGQEVWWIDTRVNSFNEQRYRIESYLIDSIVIAKEQFRYYGDDGLWLGDDELFATKEEAEQELAKIKGEKDE